MQSIIAWLLSFNESVFQAINSPASHTPPLDAIMPFTADDLIFFMPLFLLILWWTPGGKTPGASSERSTSREVVLWGVVAAALALALNVTFGAVIYEPRPFITQHVQLLVPHAADASFPSDHEAVSFAIAGVLLLRFWLTLRARTLPHPAAPISSNSEPVFSKAELSRLRWFCGVLALLGVFFACAIGYARIYVGVHYPLDILGGALIGLVSAWLVSLAQRLLRPIARQVERGAKLVHLA
jgi:undecaprenyl-diphosphatase